MNDLLAKVGAVPALAGKVLIGSGLDEIMNLMSKVSTPNAGIIYEGMRSTGQEGGVTMKTGLTTELVCSVVLMNSAKKLSIADTITPSTALLDAIRDQVKLKRSPTGHLWKFVVEAAAVEKHGIIIYVQRWATPAMLT